MQYEIIKDNIIYKEINYFEDNLIGYCGVAYNSNNELHQFSIPPELIEAEPYEDDWTDICLIDVDTTSNAIMIDDNGDYGAPMYLYWLDEDNIPESELYEIKFKLKFTHYDGIVSYSNELCILTINFSENIRFTSIQLPITLTYAHSIGDKVLLDINSYISWNMYEYNAAGYAFHYIYPSAISDNNVYQMEIRFIWGSYALYAGDLSQQNKPTHIVQNNENVYVWGVNNTSKTLTKLGFYNIQKDTNNYPIS